MGAGEGGNGMKYPKTLPAVGGLALALALSIPTALAQSQGGMGGGSPSGTGLTRPNPNTTAPGVTQMPPGMTNNVPRPLFLSGKVMMDDGTAPSEPVLVELGCRLNHVPLGYTDARGRFSIEVSQKLAVTPDASVGSYGGDPTSPFPSGPMRTIDTRRLLGCEVRASLVGYRSDVARLAGPEMSESENLGTLILHRLVDVEGTTISATSLQAPKEAKKAYSKGLDAAKKQKWPAAQAEFQKAVGIYPRYAAAWFELGQAFEHQSKPAEARKAYNQALQADNRYLNPYLPLTVMAVQENNWAAVAETSGTLVRLDPVDYPQGFVFNALANLNLNKLDVAEESARQAMKLDPDHRFPRASYILGLVLASKKDYAGALPYLREFIQRSPNAPDAQTVKKQISDVEALANARSPQPPQ
jgi:tetratricopeptide (TPR) repeat protein